jgi:calcium-dependent protein kinase
MNIGYGTYGEVYKAVERETGKIRAIKKIQIPSELAYKSDAQIKFLIEIGQSTPERL